MGRKEVQWGKGTVVGLRMANLIKSQQTCLDEIHSLLRREMRNGVVKLVLRYSVKYFEIVPATLNPESNRKLLKILE